MKSDLGAKEQKDHAVEGQNYLQLTGFDETHHVDVCPENCLFVDVDVPFSLWVPTESFLRRLQILQQRYRMDKEPIFTVEMSKGGNTHLIILLPTPTPIEERIAWQAILGGDPVREACHLLSISRHEENPIILFRKKHIHE